MVGPPFRRVAEGEAVVAEVNEKCASSVCRLGNDMTPVPNPRVLEVGENDVGENDVSYIKRRALLHFLPAPCPRVRASESFSAAALSCVALM